MSSTSRPEVVVFDVNETLSDMGPMGTRFVDVGASKELGKLWFAHVLRDGFARTVSGESERFAVLAEGVLRTLLPDHSDLDAVVDHVLSGFSELAVHDDVPDGLDALSGAGLRLVTLSNGSASVAETLLSNAGLRELFEALLSVDDAGVWKPAPGAYAHAAAHCGVPLSAMVLVAVHPWDIDGAARAGMSTCFVDRTGTPYPAHFTPPTWTVTALADLVPLLGDQA